MSVQLKLDEMLDLLRQEEAADPLKIKIFSDQLCEIADEIAVYVELVCPALIRSGYPAADDIGGVMASFLPTTRYCPPPIWMQETETELTEFRDLQEEKA